MCRYPDGSTKNLADYLNSRKVNSVTQFGEWRSSWLCRNLSKSYWLLLHYLCVVEVAYTYDIWSYISPPNVKYHQDRHKLIAEININKNYNEWYNLSKWIFLKQGSTHIPTGFYNDQSRNHAKKQLHQIYEDCSKSKFPIFSPRHLTVWMLRKLEEIFCLGLW